MSLIREYPNSVIAIKTLENLKALSALDARAELAKRIEGNTYDPSNFSLFQLVLRGTLDECRVPTPFIADGIEAEIGTVERWEMGQVNQPPGKAVIEGAYGRLPNVLRGDLPIPYDEERALHQLKKLKQLSMNDARKLLVSFIQSYAFDPYQDATFKELVAVAVRHCRVSANRFGTVMDLSPSTIYKWTGLTKEPLSRTRRKVMRVLPHLLQEPLHA